MSLTRTEYAHAKYPWEYTTGELLDLFEIDRDSQLLSAGEWQDSGILESLKMLEQQLRYLTKPAYHRYENFSGYQGSISFLYSSNAIPTLAIHDLSHSGSSVGFIMDWIDALRSDYSLSAWSWSNSGKSLFNIDLVKELWYATGLLHPNVDWDEGKRQIKRVNTLDETIYEWDIYAAGPYNYLNKYPEPHEYVPFYSTQRTLSFDETTRKYGVRTSLLFAVGSAGISFSGEETCTIYRMTELSDAEIAYLDYSSPVLTGFGGAYFPTTGTGFNCAWKIGDITTYHPISGSGGVYYKAAITEGSADDVTFVDIFTRNTSYTPVYLWQTIITNPYS